jgi:Tol biopolymer transport system component/DNA-binding winged helix-turn-helix (wHTH) protein
MPGSKAASRLTFGLYEVDLNTGELWRAGHRIKLQSQPFKVLSMLLENAGEVVTREELQLRLWGNDTIVDFDHSLATAINKIREALRDSADNPRFVETLARRGYRFIAPVNHSGATAETVAAADGDGAMHSGIATAITVEEPHAATAHGEITSPWPTAAPRLDSHLHSHGAPHLHEPGHSHAGAPLWVGAVCAAALAAGVLGGYFFGAGRTAVVPPHIWQLTSNGHLAVEAPVTENFSASVTDGYQIFVPVLEGGKSAIATVPLSGGTPVNLNIPDQVQAPTMGDISPDGSRLLLRNHLSPESEQPLWVVPASGGSALRVGNVMAHDATWMPDGHGILYAAGNDLYLTQGTDGTPQHYASLPGRAFWLRWNPAGKLLRFTVIDSITHTQSLWQMTDANRSPRPVLKDFSQPESECCGVWTADGKAYVFQSGFGGNTDLWKLAGNGTTDPVRLTDGPLEFQSPVAARSGNTIYFLGVDARSDVERLTPSGTLEPEHGFLASADRVEFSRDRKWVAWTDSAGKLWRAASDGTQKIQLTPDSLNVFFARWSPDGSRLAIMAREPGKAWQIYTVAANGGAVQQVLKEDHNSADPSWSADGQELVYGRTNDALGKDNGPRALHTLDLRTGQVSEIPGSEGLFSPRWSPDGRYIAALSLDQRQVRLYDVAAKTWKTLPVDSGADPVWSSDGKYLFIHRSLDPSQPIDRISIPDGAVKELIKLAGSSESGAGDYVFIGVTQDDAPLIRARTSIGNLYAMQIR